MSPAAIGSEVVPTLSRSKAAFTPGHAYPSVTPAAIARKIQSVRYLSKKDSLRVVGALAGIGAALIGQVLSSHLWSSHLWPERARRIHFTPVRSQRANS